MRRESGHLVLSAALAALLWAALLVGMDARSGQAVIAGSPPAAVPTATAGPAWPNDGTVDHPVVSTGCGATPAGAPGATTKEAVAVSPATNEGYATRSYWIHVPPGYDASRPTPLVLVFHGGGGTGIGMERATGWSALADRQRFLVVYPQGLPLDALGTGYTTWAATGPLDTIANGVDDLRFVSDLLDALQRLYCIDPQRIYATGFSAGGAMTSFVTCGLTGRIAAFAPMSGDAYQFKGGCFPRHPTSIIEWHGAADPSELYVGIPAREDPDWRRTGVLEWLTGWAARDGCSRGPSVFLDMPPAFGEQWTGCQAGTEVTHYRIAGLGHTWPPAIGGRSAVEIMWSFFQAHPLRAK